MRWALLACVVLAAAGLFLWSRLEAPTPLPPLPAPPAVPAPAVPSSSLVVLVMLENHGFSSVVGNPAMPYFNRLADRYSLATQYFGNTHPSIGDYFMLTTGQVITNDNDFSGEVTHDNLVRRMLAAGVTWHVYAQSLPSVGYTGGDAYPYVQRHNPFAYFSDVVDRTDQRNNLVPLDQFSRDVAAGRLPRYVYLVPDVRHDGHDCPQDMPACTRDDKLSAIDAWLASTLGPLLASPAFQQSGLLIVNWDEAETRDSAHDGGRIAVVLAGPRVKPGYRSTSFYQHQSGLRLMLEALGIHSFPGASANAPDMGEFFTP